MSLKNLKSAFSEIEKFKPTVEKTTQEPNAFEPKSINDAPDIQTSNKVDLASMVSKYSLNGSSFENTPEKSTPDISKEFGNDLGLSDYTTETIVDFSSTPEKSIPDISKGFGDDLGLDDFNPQDIIGYDIVGENWRDGTNELGLDDFNPQFEVNDIISNYENFEIQFDTYSPSDLGTLWDTNVNGTFGGPVDFFDNTGADGFTLSNIDEPFTTKFKTIDNNEFTKPFGLTFDTHTLSDITFENQTTGDIGINYMSNISVMSGFGLNFNDVSDTQFIGIDGDDWDPVTTSYYDSIHTRNPISDAFGGPVDFFDNTGADGFTLSSHEEPFTTKFKTIDGDQFTKPDGIEFDTHNVMIDVVGNKMTFENQVDEGVDFFNVPPVPDADVHAIGFTPNLTSADFENSQFQGLDLDELSYTPTTNYHGGYGINTDNIDSNVGDNIEDGTLFNPVTDFGEFGTSNVGTSLFPDKEITLQGGQKVQFTYNQFEVLYNDDQTVTGKKYIGPQGAVMSLKNDGSGNHPSDGPGGLLFGAPRGNEPYIISDINKGSSLSYGDRLIPIQAATDDVARIAKFVSSAQGIAWIVKENLLHNLGGDTLPHPATDYVGNKYPPEYYDPSSLASGIPVLGVNTRLRRDEGLAGLLFGITTMGVSYPGDGLLHEEAFLSLPKSDADDDFSFEYTTGPRSGNHTFKIGSEYEIQHFDGLSNETVSNVQLTKGIIYPGLENVENLMIVGDDVWTSNLTEENNAEAIAKENQQGSMSPFKQLSLSSVIYNNKLLNQALDKDETIGFDPIAMMDTNVVDKDGVKIPDETVENKEALNERVKNQLEEADKEKHGMPLYFRDLRDGRALIFRAYISGLNESFSPNWSSENYIGRSEPAYIYQGGIEREINFQLKMVAQSSMELTVNYEKLSRLTSMVYPEYKQTSQKTIKLQDEAGQETGEELTLDIGSVGEKTRMKPPLLKFRLGELYGSGISPNKEVTGFIKSLSYTYPDESPWETTKGYRVPKFIDIELGFQVIHDEVPSLDFSRMVDNNQNSFYGVNLNKAPFNVS